MSERGRRIFAFWLSVIGHALIVVALTFSLPLSPLVVTSGEVIVPIDTVMIDQAALDAQMAAIEAAKQAEIRREQERVRQERQQQVEAQRRRDEELRIAEQRRIQLEAEAEAREQAERDRIAEEQRAEEERRRLEAEEQARREEEARKQREAEALRIRQEAIAAEVAAAVAAEEQARAAAASGLRAQWGAQIARKVEQYWQRPPNATVGLECLLVVTQLPTGDVVGVTVSDCNVNDANIIRSLENAVTSASPLPQRPPGVEFERTVRIRFKPTE